MQIASRQYSPLVVAGLLFFIPALILVLADFNYSDPAAAARDQNLHHLPAIIAFSQHPGKPITNDFSPNIPGYYVLFGVVRHWITSSVVGLRLVNLLLTAGLVCTLALALLPGCPPVLTVFLAGPFLFSDSVFIRGIWLNTDNPAWWAILVLVLMALHGRTGTLLACTAAGLAAVAAVSIRQNHVWVIPFMLFAAFLGSGQRPRIERAAFVRAFAMAAAMLPALGIVAWFVFKWHGLVTPRFQRVHQGFSLSSVPMTFTLIAVFGAFYATTIRCVIRDRWMRDRAGFVRYIKLGLAVGVVAAVSAHTNYVPWFRDHGIWLIARSTPVYFGRSLMIALLAMVGGVAASVFLLVSASRDRWVLSAALIAFLIAQSMHDAEFERYYEPFVLILLALATSRVVSANSGKSPVSWPTIAGPAVLTLLQTIFTIWRLATPA